MADTSFLAFFLDEATDILGNWEKSCLELEQSEQRESAESLYRGAHNLKSGSAAVGLGDLSTFVHHIEDLLSKLLAGKVQSSPQLIRLFLDVHTVLSDWFTKLRSDATYNPKDACQKIEKEVLRLCGDTAPSDSSAVETAGPEAQVDVPVATEPVKEPVREEAPVIAMKPAEHGAAEGKQSAHAAKAAENIRVAAGKLDMLIQLVGELSTQQAIVWHGRQNGMLHTKGCDNAIQLMQKNSKELQGLALSLRMQSLQNLFQRLERTARDLARTQQKKIEVVTIGDHVELDRTVIERIADALMHVVRNAIDHGIEEPAKRLEAGKPTTARFQLEGSQEPGGVLITISEDGRGLNLEKILQKAIEKGLARADQKYTPAEIQRFIFAHGFSTAEKVTDISGRGVGMDIVKNAVQAIGGSIAVHSTQGRGTTFAISLPATLSIVDALIIEAGGNRYAVPVQDVSEIVDLGSFKLETASSRGRLLTLRQSIIPVEHLIDHLPKQHEFAKANASNVTERNDSIRPALLVRVGPDFLAFQIDLIIDQQPVSLRPLPAGLDAVPGYTGGSILGDGDPCIVLNLPMLARQHVEKISGQDEESSGAAQSPDSNLQSFDQALNTNRFLVFRVRDHLIAAPLLSICEILSSTPCTKMIASPPHVMGCVNVRGQILTVFDLGVLLNLSPASTDGPIILVQVGEDTLAVMVDKVEAVSDLKAVNVGDTEAKGQPFAGGKSKLITGVTTFRSQMISMIDFANILTDINQTAGNLLPLGDTAIKLEAS